MPSLPVSQFTYNFWCQAIATLTDLRTSLHLCAFLSALSSWSLRVPAIMRLQILKSSNCNGQLFIQRLPIAPETREPRPD